MRRSAGCGDSMPNCGRGGSIREVGQRSNWHNWRPISGSPKLRRGPTRSGSRPVSGNCELKQSRFCRRRGVPPSFGALAEARCVRQHSLEANAVSYLRVPLSPRVMNHPAAITGRRGGDLRRCRVETTHKPVCPRKSTGLRPRPPKPPKPGGTGDCNPEPHTATMWSLLIQYSSHTRGEYRIVCIAVA